MVSWSGSSGIGRLLVLGGIVGKSVHDLNTDLLGKGELHSLASGSSQGSDTLLKSFRNNLNLWDSDTFLFGEVFTADSWEGDGLVDTGLDWLGVSDSNGRLNNGNNRDVVASLLGDLLAVIMSISASMSISILGRLADGHHLGLTLLVEGNLNSLGSCLLTLRLVRVGAHLIVNLLNALGTDSTGDCVALLNILNVLTGEFDWVAHSLKSRGANFSSLNYILDGAVVLGVLIAIAGLVVGRLMVRGGLMVGRLRVGRLMVGGLVVGLSWNTSHKGHKN
jgi:hypothetical protein